MITSAHNPKIQRVRALIQKRAERDGQAAFVVEGVRLAEEALTAGWVAQLVLYAAGLSARGEALLPRFALAGAEVEEVPQALLESISGTEASQGILVVMAQRSLPWPARPDFLLVADGLRDPGNLGTLMRTAEAAGVQGVILTPGSVDVFSPKVVRSAMGAHFRLPTGIKTWDEIGATCHAIPDPLRIYLSDAECGQPLWQTDMRSPVALVIGAEAEGVSEQAARHADGYIRIPMPGRSESLNAAIAAGVFLFEVVRQRKING